MCRRVDPCHHVVFIAMWRRLTSISIAAIIISMYERSALFFVFESETWKSNELEVLRMENYRHICIGVYCRTGRKLFRHNEEYQFSGN